MCKVVDVPYPSHGRPSYVRPCSSIHRRLLGSTDRVFFAGRAPIDASGHLEVGLIYGRLRLANTQPADGSVDWILVDFDPDPLRLLS